MKRVIGLISAAVLICNMNSSAELITVNLDDASVNNNAYFNGDLSHDYAYYWRVNIDAYTGGAELESASLQILGLNNIPEPDFNDSLYITLMDVNTPYDQSKDNQLNLYADHGAWGNFFDKEAMNTQTSSTSPYDNYTNFSNVATFNDDNSWFWFNPAEDVSVDLNVDLINSYKNDYGTGYPSSTSNGFIAIGLDADCHYEGNVSLLLNTAESVPEPSILSLIGCGLLGFVFIRRKKK